MHKADSHHWWQRGIVYQVYPRSFQDANGDGVGDLQGIIQRLDYLMDLGVHAIWISPIYPSPMADFGYDISNYVDIHPLFGSLADFDQLLSEVHRRKMKVILDFVPNHTSDQHPWFIESRSSKENKKRDWYIWRDAKPDGTFPNNWLAAFGGPAWEWDPQTKQFYYHAFLKEQPDLNWRNPEVQKAMLEAMRFWLDRGVDGFRVDVMWHMIKDEMCRDNPVNPNYQSHMPTCDQVIQLYSTDQPEVHAIVRIMRKLLDEYPERMMIGEIYLPIPKLVTYYGDDGGGAHLPFNFHLISTPWDPVRLASMIDEYEQSLPEKGWPNWVLGNHDVPRVASRLGIEQAKVAGMLLLTLRGTPTIYYGDELGMKDVLIPAEEMRDPQGLNMPDKNLTRDYQRSPMLWDESSSAGFTTGKPWLRTEKRAVHLNASRQRNDPDSMLNFFRRMIRLRNEEPALSIGNYRTVYADHQILAFERSVKSDGAFLIALNLTHRPAFFANGGIYSGSLVMVSTFQENEGREIGERIYLEPDEGVVIRVSKRI